MKGLCRRFCGIVGLVLAIAVPCFAGPPTVFGTKADTAPSPSQTPGLGFMPLLQMMLALGIVLVLIKYVLPKLLGGINKKLVTKSGSGIDIEETASFAGGQLYVVSVRGKTLLLGSSQAGVACLADLGPKKSKTEQPLFMEMLDKETEHPSHLYVDAQGEPSPAMKSALSDEEVQAALERLNKLGG